MNSPNLTRAWSVCGIKKAKNVSDAMSGRISWNQALTIFFLMNVENCERGRASGQRCFIVPLL